VVNFCHLVTQKKKKKSQVTIPTKRIFWEENVPMSPDFDGKNSEIITFIQ
jgi:hypothetical protein